MSSQPTKGRVLLVGAGPGPADLMTVRAQQAVRAAQAVLYDALVSPEVLELAPASAIRIETGKRGGKASMGQAEINRLMLELAQRGLDVVRLKGGDPSVFGRSGEETTFLAEHGVAFEIIPGVTAASAAAAQFGFPLTYRQQARRLILATARTEGGVVTFDTAAALLADPEATLALYMARDSLGEIGAALVAAGRDGATSALAVENAGHDAARAIRSDLAGLAAAVQAAGFSGPVVVIVGAVAGLAR
jgi:uroporphyrin-III C-methyltransferase